MISFLIGLLSGLFTGSLVTAVMMLERRETNDSLDESK